MPSTKTRRPTRTWWPLAAAGGVVAILALLWKWSSLSIYVDPEMVSRWLETWQQNDWMIPLTLCTYVLTSLVMFPNVVLNVAIVLTVGGIGGVALAVGGSLFAASVFFAIGRRFGQGALGGKRVAKLEKAATLFRQSGILGVASVRLIPIAPFSAVNLMAGAMRIPYFNFAVGSLIGLLPSTILIAVFGVQVRRAIQSPSPDSVGILAILALAMLLLAALARRIYRTRSVLLGGPDTRPSQPEP